MLLTEYVSTRWYRAPEILLRTRDYNAPVDVFAVGGIMAELYMLRPLFPGNSESDMIKRVCRILGTPNMSTWPDGMKYASNRRVQFPDYPKTPMEKLMPHASVNANELMDNMMQWDPSRRPTCSELLKHSYFQLETVEVSSEVAHTSRTGISEIVEPKHKGEAKKEKNERREKKTVIVPQTDTPHIGTSLPSLSPHSKQFENSVSSEDLVDKKVSNAEPMS